MFNRIFTMMVVLLVLATTVGSALAMCYPAVWEFVDVNKDGAEIFIDSNGEAWEIMSNEAEWFFGDWFAVLLDDNGTPETVHDDVILDYWWAEQ